MRRIVLSLMMVGCVAPGSGKPPDPHADDPVDLDGDGSTSVVDCDDENVAVNPLIPETCNGLDENCDGQIDEGVLSTFYADTDGDSFGDPAVIQETCLPPVGFVEDSTDCDDASASNYPGAPEVCDGADNNCSGLVDEGVGVLFYEDLDGDGHGSASVSTQACAEPDGYAAVNDDCDDENAAIYPGNAESCDGLDNDCSGSIDEGVLLAWYADRDADGHGDPSALNAACAAPVGHVASGADCDDTEPLASPDLAEVCDNIDNDCDGAVDVDATDATTFYQDLDADTFGDAAALVLACAASSGLVEDATDCDDTNASVWPGAVEVCDGLDNDCDGINDLDAVDIRAWYADNDADGYGAGVPTYDCASLAGHAENADDCDDGDGAISPIGLELCNSADDDCDGVTDEDDAADATFWFPDGDGDGFGDPTLGAPACSAPVGSVGTDGDCDDTDAAVNPDGAERCNGYDDDCDGDTDEPDAVDAQSWYLDADADGYGDVNFAELGCTAPADHVASADDCDDAWPSAYPGGTEVCDSHDNNCDGVVDEASATDAPTWYVDVDRDGYGQTSVTAVACNAPLGYVFRSGDCDDTTGAIAPDNNEICDDIDNNCDTLVDNDAVDALPWYPDDDIDRYGDPTRPTAACDRPVGHISDNQDCDDTNDQIHPGADEYCGVIDYDCDGIGGSFDGPVDPLTFYADLDSDGWGDPTWARTGCTLTSHDVMEPGDCDDTDADAYPNAHLTEVPSDGVDTDCDDQDGCADLNCDSWPDVVFVNYQDGASTAVNSTIYYGAADRFASPSSTELPTLGASAGAVADLDLDGYLDVVFANTYDSTTGSYNIDSYVYWGSASGHSAADRLELPTSGAMDVCVADLNDDDVPDLAFANYFDGVSYDIDSVIYYGPDFTTSTLLPTQGAQDCVAADITPDGYTDLVFGSYRSDATVLGGESKVYFQNAVSHSFSPSAVESLEAGGRVPKVYAGDLDGVGGRDVMLVVHYDGDFATESPFYTFSSAGVAAAPYTIPATGPWAAVFAPMDADVFPDLALASAQETISDYLVETRVYTQSVAAYTTAAVTGLPNAGAKAVLAYNLEGPTSADLDMDLIYANRRASTAIYETDSVIYQNTGSFALGGRVALPTSGASGLAIGDLDEDGFPDIVFANERNNAGSYTIESVVYWGDGVISNFGSESSFLPTRGPVTDPILVGVE